MHFISLHKCIYVGYSAQEKDSIRALLKSNGISSFEKTWNAQGPIFPPRSPLINSFGQNPKLQYTYEVYVHNQDYEQAYYLIQKANHQIND